MGPVTRCQWNIKDSGGETTARVTQQAVCMIESSKMFSITGLGYLCLKVLVCVQVTEVKYTKYLLFVWFILLDT